MTENDSILNTIKQLLNIETSDTDFDNDLIVCINTAFANLSQIGAGEDTGFAITGSSETWASYLNGNLNLRNIITFIHLKVKLLFDPPTNSSVLQAYQNELNELTWRINVAVETPRGANDQ